MKRTVRKSPVTPNFKPPALPVRCKKALPFQRTKMFREVTELKNKTNHEDHEDHEEKEK
jgi:hypothetical protein